MFLFIFKRKVLDCIHGYYNILSLYHKNMSSQQELHFFNLNNDKIIDTWLATEETDSSLSVILEFFKHPAILFITLPPTGG